MKNKSTNEKLDNLGGRSQKEGVLIMNGIPFYIVDFYYIDEAIPMVSVFGIKDTDKKDYLKSKSKDINNLHKDYELNSVEQPLYKFSTDFSEALQVKNNLKESKKIGYRKRYYDPLFIGVVGEGTSTVTGDYTQLGFYDKSTSGASTGIFIALDDITWFDHNIELSIMEKAIDHQSREYIDQFLGSLDVSDLENSETESSMNPRDDLQW